MCVFILLRRILLQVHDDGAALVSPQNKCARVREERGRESQRERAKEKRKIPRLWVSFKPALPGITRDALFNFTSVRGSLRLFLPSEYSTSYCFKGSFRQFLANLSSTLIGQIFNIFFFLLLNGSYIKKTLDALSLSLYKGIFWGFTFNCGLPFLDYDKDAFFFYNVIY